MRFRVRACCTRLLFAGCAREHPVLSSHFEFSTTHPRLPCVPKNVTRSVSPTPPCSPMPANYQTRLTFPPLQKTAQRTVQTRHARTRAQRSRGRAHVHLRARDASRGGGEWGDEGFGTCAFLLIVVLVLVFVRQVAPRLLFAHPVLRIAIARLFAHPVSFLLAPFAHPVSVSLTRLLSLTPFCSQMALKRPHAISFSKKNDVRPFEDAASFEFWAQKNDASVLVLGQVRVFFALSPSRPLPARGFPLPARGFTSCKGRCGCPM